jgi:hypothetical protein
MKPSYRPWLSIQKRTNQEGKTAKMSCLAEQKGHDLIWLISRAKHYSQKNCGKVATAWPLCKMQQMLKPH